MRDGTRRAASAHLASLRLNQGVPTTPSIPTFDRRSPLDSISRLRPRRGGTSTSQGHPRTIFRRALEHDNLVLAEVTAREIGRVTIAEALELTALVARKQPQTLRPRRRPLAVPLSRGTRKGDARRCRAPRLEAAIARDPKGPRLGARDPEEGLGEARPGRISPP